MSELPQLDGQIRVLVIEDDMMAVRTVLVRCTEAGMDTRYAPFGTTALEAMRSIKPHLILLGVSESEEQSLKLAISIGRESAAPLLVLTDARANLKHWHEYLHDASHFITRDLPVQAVLERITFLIRDTYHEKQLMVAETPVDSDVTGVPTGWGKCQHCGYIGPRKKFLDPNRLARHPFVCPVCKQYDDIVFAVS